MSIPTLREILERHSAGEALLRDLLEREDTIADFLRLAGVQFGTFPELVAKVLMDAGLGTPPTPELREHINQQFAARLMWLSEQFDQ